MRGRFRVGLSGLCVLLSAWGCAERGVGVQSRDPFATQSAVGGSAAPQAEGPGWRLLPGSAIGRPALVGLPLVEPDVPSEPLPAESETAARESGVTCLNRTGFKAGETFMEPLPALDPPRHFYVSIPSGYDGTIALPVVIDFHGLGGRADDHEASQLRISGWREKGELENFITVFPVGLDASWNGGKLCCHPSNAANVDDVGFAREIVKHLSRKACIDSSRVYATGLGNGGALAHLLACQAADVFAATAPVSMGNGSPLRECRPARPISVVMFRGTEDATVNYFGGVFPSAQEDLEHWKAVNECRGAPIQSHEGRCLTYSQCRERVRVTLCSPRAGNVLYAAAAQQNIAVPDIAWDIFRTQRLY